MKLIVRLFSSSTGMHVPPEPVVLPVIGVDATMIAHGSNIALLSAGVYASTPPVLLELPQPASAYTTSDILLIVTSVLRRRRRVRPVAAQRGRARQRPYRSASTSAVVPVSPIFGKNRWTLLSCASRDMSVIASTTSVTL